SSRTRATASTGCSGARRGADGRAAGRAAPRRAAAPRPHDARLLVSRAPAPQYPRARTPRRWGAVARPATILPGGAMESMSDKLSRREFLVTSALTGAAASTGLASARPLFATGGAPAVHVRAARPGVVAAATGHPRRHGA